MELASLAVPAPVLPGPIDDDPPLLQLTAVTVLAPAAGASFSAGQLLTVQWNTTGPVDAHAVLLSTDGGGSFSNVSGADLPGSARSFAFVLPAPALATAQAVVRVRAKLAGSGVARGDSAPFTLSALDLLAPEVSVLAPAAGALLPIGQPADIHWTSSDNLAPASHKVLLSTDGGASFRDISPTLPGTARSFTYTPVAADASPQVRVRVAARDAAGNRGSGDSALLTIATVLPLIERITPAQGYAGQGVLIEGRRLGTVRQVLFGGTVADFQLIDDFRIAAFVPILRSPSQGPLPVVISVQADERTASAPQAFTVTPLPAPRIDRVEPPSAAVGDWIRLVGSGLLQVSAAPTTLSFFDGVPASVIRSDPAGSGSFIDAQVPAGARSGPVTLVTPGGSASAPFSVPVAAGSVTLSASPAALALASGGSAVLAVAIGRSNAAGPITLTVSGLPAGASASFNPNPAPGGSAQLTLATAAGATALGTRTLTIGGSIAGSTVPVAPAAVQLTVLDAGPAPDPAPVISGFSPPRGAPGSAVRIEGRNFADLVVVDLGGAPLQDVRADPAGLRIDATLPPNANTGRFLVRTAAGSALSDGVFIVDSAAPPPPPLPTAPTVTGFRPARGRMGTPVTVTGSGFAEGETSVRFNGTPAAVSVLDPTRLATVVPAGAASGPIEVATRQGTARSSTPFTVF